MASISSNIAVAMYGIYHPDYEPQRWHIFIGYLIVTWMCCCIVLFANKALPMINNIGMTSISCSHVTNFNLGLFLILAGVFITVITCAVLPSHRPSGHAPSSFVWRNWSNQTGYSSNGFVFLAGMLNGAYSVGTPDCVSHLAEEIPNPRRNIPLAIGAQMTIGFVTALAYMIAIFYAISDLEAILAAPYFPLAQIYAQATSSTAGTVGLLLVIFLPVFCTGIGCYVTAGRCLWTLARDGAVPFSSTIGGISPKYKNPWNATLACGVFSTILGAVSVGSTTAFNAFVGSFVVLSTLSYLAAILPFLLTGRFSHLSVGQGRSGGQFVNGMRPGPFQMGRRTGYAVNGIACVYIGVFVVIFCFPYVLPVTALNMNYACVIAGGVSVAAGCWWLIKGKTYVGPQAVIEEGGILEPVEVRGKNE